MSITIHITDEAFQGLSDEALDELWQATEGLPAIRAELDRRTGASASRTVSCSAT